MNDKPLKPRMTHDQHIYGWMLKRGQLESYDLSWPCLTAHSSFFTDRELAAHREVTAIFKRMGVR